MLRTLRTGGLLAAVLILAAAAPLHITPTVVLVKRVDVIKTTLRGATQYFQRTVDIGRDDLGRIRRAADFTPESAEIHFYYGTDAGGMTTGVVLFPQVNSQHGPLEVGLTIGPDGAIANAVVTKATVETKPWVRKAVKTGFMDQFKGIRQPDNVDRALETISRGDIGAMPSYMAEQVTLAVKRGLVLYQVLFASRGDQAAR
jgi:hypothetical protein